MDPKWSKLHDAGVIERIPYLILIAVLVLVGSYLARRRRSS